MPPRSFFQMNTNRQKVLFLHGWFSTGAVKTLFMRSLGYNVLTPRLSNWFFGRAVKTAKQSYDQFGPVVVVGSSRGGAVAMNIDVEGTPLILLAPAWRHFGRVDRLKPNCIVIHSPHDETIPFSDSVLLCERSPEAVLVAEGQDHKLNCPEGRRALKWALNTLLG